MILPVLFATAAGPDMSWIRAVPPSAEPVTLPIGLVVAAVVIAALAALFVTWAVNRDRARHGPAVRGLARALGLGFAERRLLQRVAAQSGLSCAGGLMLSRGCFEDAAKRWGGDGARLDAIRRAIFTR